MSAEALAPRGSTELAYRHELTVEELAAQVEKIHAVMQKLMKPDVHYGTIPGTKKPTLYKPGGELLCMLFRLDPEYAIEEIRDGDHLTVRSTVTLWHIPTGLRMGSGMGSCSTREAKYAYRRSGRTCPTCGKDDTIIKGKAEYGGGWLCFGKKGGCGAKFKDGDAAIEKQQTEERVANPDLPDTYNTVLKMSNKRGLVAGVLNVTAASEIFTQDVDKGDERDEEEEEAPPRQAERGEATPPAASQQSDGPISEPQQKRLWAIAREQLWSQDDVKALLASLGVEHTKDLPPLKYEGVIQTIKAEKKRPPSAATTAQGSLA
jgi:hypothetical protein